MKPTPPLGPAARFFVAALVLLGLVGGSLVVAHAGFETSPRRGGPTTFVPAPQAYLMTAVMYGMSCIALLALLRDRRVSARVTAAAMGCWVLAAAGLVVACRPG